MENSFLEKLWRCPIRGENWFLSVPSAGRVTGCTSRASGGRAYFYPRPPRGGRPQCISGQPETRRCLSTPSARRATLCLVVTFHFRDISIHALREEGDTLQSKSTERLFDFYPRPPRGGRRAQHGRLSTRRRTFLSTPSARRATSAGQQVPPESQYFYPRPPRGGRPEIW